MEITVWKQKAGAKIAPLKTENTHFSFRLFIGFGVFMALLVRMYATDQPAHTMIIQGHANWIEY